MPSQTARPAQPATAPTWPVWTQEHVQLAMDNHGCSDWTINYLIPGPFPVEEMAAAVEVTRQRNNGLVELKVFTFKPRRNRNGEYLELLQSFAEPEYASLLRRRHRNVEFYYVAQQRYRRRLVAQVLSGGADQYQLLLGPVVDDEELRLKLTSPAYKVSKSKSELARKRMGEFRSQRSQLATNNVALAPQPETNRGVRAQSANMRRRDNDSRRRPRSNPAIDAAFAFAEPSSRRGL